MTELVVSLAMITTTICSPTEVELLPSGKHSRRSTKHFSKNTAPCRRTMTMPSPRRTMHSLGCYRLSGKWKIPEETTRLIMSCERRSSGCEWSCEFSLSVETWPH